MKKIVPLTLISLIYLSLPATAKDVQSSAKGDICEVRPDLCGGPPRVKRKKPAPRKLDLSRDPDEAARAEQEIERDFFDMENDNPAAVKRRQPAAAAPVHFRRSAPLPSTVTYESYLQANASHPAIARRPASMAANQKAFVQPVVRTTITGSTLDQNAGKPISGANVNQPAAGRGVGDAQPASDGVNPGDEPISGAAGDAGSPNR